MIRVNPPSTDIADALAFVSSGRASLRVRFATNNKEEAPRTTAPKSGSGSTGSLWGDMEKPTTFEVLKEKGIITVGFTGTSGGTMKSLSDYLINIPSTDTPRIQESHIMAGHIICQLVEEKLYPHPLKGS